MSAKDPNTQFHYPSPREDFIITISCGNTHLHWATHHGVNEDFNPKIFWRTPHVSAEDMTSGDDLVTVLSRLIPDDAHDYLWGPDNDASIDAAIEQSKLRAVPEISVFVVSSNDGQAEMLEKLMQTIPSKFCVVQGDMFFTEDQGRYPTMGADRLATLAGAAHMHGHPALVFDGGTATTYTATDCSGRILGGGIGPGIRTKLKSMAESTAALPDLSSKVDARVNAAVGDAGNGPLPTFARNTEDAMLTDLFQDLAMKGRNVISTWLRKAFKSSKPQTVVFKRNKDKRVICTGGDGEVLHKLLSPDAGGLIEVDDQEERGYEIEPCKYLIHYGVTAILYSHAKLQQKKDEFVKKNEDEHVGKRVAKVFDIEEDDGDNIFRGTVQDVVKTDGKKEYRIKYDDGDIEDVSEDTLFGEYQLLRYGKTHLPNLYANIAIR
jgi:pantothenate kinase type III